MTLGFHYHIPFAIYNEDIFLPSHFGIFIDELSRHVLKLKLILYRSPEYAPDFFDYKVDLTKIEIIPLGVISPTYIRFIMGKRVVKSILSELKKCDFLLLRGPSPINHDFVIYYPRERIINLVVGDFKMGNKFIRQPWYRLYGVKLLNLLIHNAYIKSIKDTKLAFNSEVLYDKYAYLSSNSTIINTSNIYFNDLQWIPRFPLKSKQTIKLLYVGRLEWAKGLNELIGVLKLCNRSSNKTFELHIVGWDDTPNKAVIKLFEKRLSNEGLIDKFFFHGKKKPGKELYAYYQMADIFLLPSYQEGFPRTIWEAFANCIPVITTPVGSISRKLIEYKHALFCQVQDSKSIVEKIDLLINNDLITQTIIKNGYEMVNENTIEFQTLKLISFINNGSKFKRSLDL